MAKIDAGQVDRFVTSFLVPPGKQISLRKDYDPSHTADGMSQEEARARLDEGVEILAEFQSMLYAQNTFAVLVILQAMDAAGKDSTIKHVMSGLNPLGTQVFSFKAPSPEELDHDYLWRCFKALPERGRIGIFNRSYYEEVLVVRVHPEILDHQQLPAHAKGKNVWQHRFEEINHFESYLTNNGIIVVKIFLNVSKAEQKKRFLKRINEAEKNWKFAAADVKERAHWDDYMAAYEDMFNHTSTPWAPWYIVPADAKWFTRLGVAAIIYGAMMKLDLHYPVLPDEHMRQLQEAKTWLESET